MTSKSKTKAQGSWAWLIDFACWVVQPPVWIFLIIASVAVYLVFYWYADWVVGRFPEPTDRGTFGDMFGALTGWVTAVALATTVYALQGERADRKKAEEHAAEQAAKAEQAMELNRLATAVAAIPQIEALREWATKRRDKYRDEWRRSAKGIVQGLKDAEDDGRRARVMLSLITHPSGRHFVLGDVQQALAVADGKLDLVFQGIPSEADWEPVHEVAAPLMEPLKQVGYLTAAAAEAYAGRADGTRLAELPSRLRGEILQRLDRRLAAIEGAHQAIEDHRSPSEAKSAAQLSRVDEVEGALAEGLLGQDIEGLLALRPEKLRAAGRSASPTRRDVT